MASPLGTSTPLSLAAVPLPEDLAAFQAHVRARLGVRKDTARNITAFVGAVASCPLDLFGLADLPTHAAPGLAIAEHRLRTLLTGGGVEEPALVRALAQTSPLSMTTAALLQYEEVEAEEGPPWALMSLSALRPGASTPLAWERFRLAPEADVAAAERRCLEQLLATAMTAWADSEPDAHETPPILALDPCFGETRRLRRTLADAVPEYALEVRADCNDHRVLRRDVYGQRDPGAPLVEVFGSPSADGPLPPPLSVDPAVVSRGELAVPFRLGPDVRYAIVRAFDRAEMRGHRGLRRAVAVAHLLARVDATSMAGPLAISSLQLGNDPGWRTAALLLSLFQSFLVVRAHVEAPPAEGGRR